MKRMSLDIETGGIGPGKVVLTIGVAIVDDDDERPSHTTLIPLDIETQVHHGLIFDPSTLQWWMNQGSLAREEAWGGHIARMSVGGALTILRGLWQAHDCSEVWGNGPTFDVVMLEALAERMGLAEPPWSYHQVRCLRTLTSLCPDVPRVQPTIPHSAVADALAQGLWARACLKHLGAI